MIRSRLAVSARAQQALGPSLVVHDVKDNNTIRTLDILQGGDSDRKVVEGISPSQCDLPLMKGTSKVCP